jgi:hypothetical protein
VPARTASPGATLPTRLQRALAAFDAWKDSGREDDRNGAELLRDFAVAEILLLRQPASRP